MPTYNYLPGTVVRIQDGGLTSQFAPHDDAILLIGTAGQGVCDSPYQVTDRALSSLEFGFAGTLGRAIEECATYSDNIIAFRMGSSPLVLGGVGLDNTVGATSPGFNITFTDATADAATRYKVWYKAGVLAVWKDNELQYSNQTGSAVDTSDIVLSALAAGNIGTPLVAAGAGSTPDLAHAVTVTAAVALTGTTDRPIPAVTQTVVTGLGMTGRQKYIALRRALELLQGIQAKIVYCPDAQFDQANVAFYNSATTIGTGPSAFNPTLANNPVTNADSLDWLKVTKDSYGANIYQWAGDTVDSTGATVSAYGGATTPTILPVTSGVTASTTSVGSVLTLTAATSGTLISGSLSFKVGVSGTPVVTTLAPGVTLAAAVTAILAAVSAASVTGVTVVVGSGGAANKILITGPIDISVNGTNTIAVINNALTQPGTSAPGFADVATRQAAGFQEINFGSTLGNFCADLSQLGPLAVAVIGCSQPVSANLVNTRKWVGFLPSLDGNGKISASGSGLLGIPYLVGCHVENLNRLCADFSNGFRLPGMYVTLDESYDGEPSVDGNGNVEDAGRHLHVVADWAFMSNGWAINYVQNIAGLVTGFMSALDPASGLTNKQVKATQIWQPTPVQMDALTKAKINVLRFQGLNTQPVLLHDLTAATDASDYTNLVRVRCFSLVIATLLRRASGYVGHSSLDGLTLVAMKTQLDQDLNNLTKRGYCNHSTVTIASTAAQQKIGHATLNLVCHPADELIQLTANVGVGR